MIKKPTKKSVALAVSAALATSLAASPLTHANPPSDNSSLLNAATLAGGYMQFALNGEGKCGEGKCGDARGEKGKGEKGKGEKGKGEKGKEGKCGEGKCGGA